MKKTYKVAVLIDQLIPGGVQKIATSQVRGLKSLGFDSTLLILMRDGYHSKFNYLVKDIPHRFLSDEYPLIFKKNIKLPFFSFLSILHLLSPILAIGQLRKYNPDIIISHGSTTSFTALAAKRFIKIPYIFMIHDPMIYIFKKIYSKSPLWRISALIKLIVGYIEKKIVENAQICVIDSRFHQKFIMEKYKVNPQILYLGINNDQEPLSGLGDHILTSGRWGKGKNLQLLLGVLPYFPKTKLTVAGIWGNQDDLRWFKNLVLEMGLKERVRIITNYKDQDFREICSQARVWVLPHQEAFSISALEAASVGLPIIIPKKSGVTDFLINREDGIFLEKVTGKSLAEALKVFIENKRFAQKVGESAFNKVSKFYKFSNHLIKLSKLIDSCFLDKSKKIVALEAGHVGKIGIAGGDILLSKMVNYLKTSYELLVIIPKNNTRHWRDLGDKVKLVTLKHTLLDEFTSAWLVLINYLLRIVLIIPKVLKNPNGTIIYSSTDTLPDVIPAYVAKIINRSYRWIARIHHFSPPPHKRPGNFLINIGSIFIQKISTYVIKSKSDIVLVLNSSLKKTLINKGFPKEKLYILGGGVDFYNIKKFRPEGNEGFDAVYLGRIHATKGVFDLPKIWSKVLIHKPSATLAVIGSGSGSNFNKLNNLIDRGNLSNNMFVLGFISKSRLWTILKNSKVFLFTDHEAGWGLAVAEAMASGMPIVGWDIGILGKVFKRGFIKVKHGNISAFAVAVVNILSNDLNYKKLSKEARDEAANFDWLKVSNKFYEILEKFKK